MNKKNNVAKAEAYYKAISEKNLKEAAQYLHPNIQFISPLENIEGKDAFLAAIKKCTTVFKTITIRAKVGSGNKVMFAYDVEFFSLIGNFPTAALMTFQNGLIIKNELFYDSYLIKEIK